MVYDRNLEGRLDSTDVGNVDVLMIDSVTHPVLQVKVISCAPGEAVQKLERLGNSGSFGTGLWLCRYQVLPDASLRSGFFSIFSVEETIVSSKTLVKFSPRSGKYFIQTPHFPVPLEAIFAGWAPTSYK